MPGVDEVAPFIPPREVDRPELLVVFQKLFESEVVPPMAPINPPRLADPLTEPVS